MLSSAVLWFERDWDAPGQPFSRPARWARSAMASISTHDLPTVAGWLGGEHVRVRAELGLLDRARRSGVRGGRRRPGALAELLARGRDSDRRPGRRAARPAGGRGVPAGADLAAGRARRAPAAQPARARWTSTRTGGFPCPPRWPSSSSAKGVRAAAAPAGSGAPVPGSRAHRRRTTPRRARASASADRPNNRLEEYNVPPWPGTPYPLGATYDGAGTNFALFSEVAERVELCLFDDEGNETRSRCPRWTASCTTATCPASAPASATGTGCTARTTRPAASAATRTSCCSTRTPRRSRTACDWDESLFGYQFGNPDERNDDDSAGRSAVLAGGQPVLRLGQRPSARTPYNETVIYEAHVKGLTMHHPTCRRSCAAPTPVSAHPLIIEHLTELGMTAVELMPVHQFVTDHGLAERACATTGATTRSASSLRTTPTRRCPAQGGQVQEFKAWCGPCTRPASR